MDIINSIVENVNSYLWDYILIFLLCGTGLYFTFRLKFIQVRKFGKGIKSLFSSFSLNGKKADKDGMSSFQALTTAIAAQVGTGNIAGAATAIAVGGPGAIFWMWLSAFFGMGTIYAEAVLAQKFRTVGKDGQITGGPIYYIKAAFKGKFGKFLASFFSVAIILALGFMGNMVQSNSIGSAFATVFGESFSLNLFGHSASINVSLVVGIIVAAVAAVIFLGGSKRIASVTEKIVPLMALLYIVGCLVILGMNYMHIGNAFKQIFVMAFNPEALGGGALGITVMLAVRKGIARGLFSNEAGMGSTPHAHALAKVKHPSDQGILAIVGVFIDTFVVLTLTALVIISTGSWNNGETGAALAQSAFSSAFGATFGNIFIAVCMLFFAFSTIISWYFFGEQNIKALFGTKSVKIYSIIVILFIVLGSTLKVDLVWNMSDMFNGLMVIPNLIGLLALSGLVVKITKDYDKESHLQEHRHK